MLRLGVAFAFLYPPISAFFDPYSWIGFFPSFVRAIPVDEMILLHAFGVVEVIIGLWILSGRRIFIPSALAFLALLAIVIFNAAQFEILFRDLSIAAMAFALALDARKK